MSVPVLASNNQLNIRGVVASNINNTPSLSSTFPTVASGSSLGHYQYTNPSTNSLKLLNACGTNTGGHEFWVSSSTSIPVQTAQIDASGLTIDNSTTSNIVYSPNVFSLDDNGKSIRFPVGTNLTASPYNMTQVFNPVYITQSNALYTAGSLVYAVLQDNESVQLFNNDNLANPIPPNEVPSDFGNSTNVGITVGIPLFSLTAGTPSTTKTTNLNEVLTIVEDNDISVLSSNDLLFNSVSLPSTVSTNTSNIATNTSNIATNTSNIATNTSDIATNTSNIATNTSNILLNAQKQVISQTLVSSPAIYADSSIPIQSSPFLSTYGFGGWAYKKASPQSSNAKINWYFAFPNIGATVGDLKGLYYQIFNNCSSSDALPFFTVYTRPTGINDYASWYHSSMTYVCTTNSPANQTVQAYANIKALTYTPNSLGIQNQLPMIQSTVYNPKGTYLDTDVILFISFGTNSASPLNAVDFSCSKIGMITSNFTAEYNLI